MSEHGPCGLTTGQLREIRRVLTPWADRIDAVIMFGSRAEGTQRSGSDVDLALSGDLGPRERAAIEGAFDESSLPHEVDVVILGPDTPPELADHIARVGHLLWVRPHLQAAAATDPTGANVT